MVTTDKKTVNEKASSKYIDKADLLYPFAVVLMMLSIFDLTGIIVVFGIISADLVDILNLDESTIPLLDLTLNLIAQCFMIMSFLLLYKFKKIEPEEKVMPQGNHLGTIYLIHSLELLVITIIAIIIQLVLGVLNPEESPYQIIAPNQVLLQMPIYYILFFGVLIFGASVGEEFVFRRSLIPFLERRGIGTFWVLIISSLMFSLIHTPADLILGSFRYAINHFFSTFTGGIALGYIYMRTRNIIYPMMFHALTNGLSGLAMIAEETGDLFYTSIIGMWIFIALLTGIGVVIYGLMQIRRYQKSYEKPIWMNILTETEFRQNRLVPVFVLMFIFILIEGGRQVLFEVLFNQDQFELETAIEIIYFLILLLVLGLIIFKIKTPLQTADLISTSITLPISSSSFISWNPNIITEKTGNLNFCTSCGKPRVTNALYCVYCGEKYIEFDP